MIFRFEADFFEQAFHHGLQAARPDILYRFVHASGQLGNFGDGIFGKVESDVFGTDKGFVLFNEIGPRFLEDAHEVFFGQRTKFHPDGQTSLKLRKHVRRFGDVEGTAGNEQNMVGLHRAVFCRDRRAFDERQEIALNAFAADGSAPHIGDCDLVDLVEEYDPVRFRIFQRDAIDVILVHTFFGFFVDEAIPGIGHLQLATLHRVLAHGLAKHIGQVNHAHAAGHSGNIHLLAGLVANLDFHFGIVHRIFDDTLAEGFTRRFAGIFANQCIKKAVHRRLAGRIPHRFAAAFLFQTDRLFCQIAGDLVDIAADVTDFGELGRLDLDEGCLCQFGETTADFGFAATGRADHQNVLGRDLVAQFRAETLAPPAIA